MSATERINELLNDQIDGITIAHKIIDYGHHEIHGGSRYFVHYSVADLGAATTPNDTMTLTFKTPDSTTWSHFNFVATGTSGWRVRLIEAPTGGAASATGTLTIHNHDRNSQVDKPSTITNVAGTAGVVDYDATLATGGTTLFDDYIAGSTSGITGSGNSAARNELILKQNTTYQLSMFGTDNQSGTLEIDWYEHTNRS